MSFRIKKNKNYNIVEDEKYFALCIKGTKEK